MVKQRATLSFFLNILAIFFVFSILASPSHGAPITEHAGLGTLRLDTSQGALVSDKQLKTRLATLFANFMLLFLPAIPCWVVPLVEVCIAARLSRVCTQVCIKMRFD